MKAEENGMKIVMQVGTELRISNNGEVVIDNPELELVGDEEAADAVLVYRFDPQTKTACHTADRSTGGPEAYENSPQE